MYSNIDDCDEGNGSYASFIYQPTDRATVYNFWEPLHFFDKGVGFQTWEVTPQYAIRSWAYILLHLLPVRLASFIFGNDKVSIAASIVKVLFEYNIQRPAFFALRIALAGASTFSEVYLYRQVYEKVNNRVGRYLFFMLAFSAGMWNASTGGYFTSSVNFIVQLIVKLSSHPHSPCICLPLRLRHPFLQLPVKIITGH